MLTCARAPPRTAICTRRPSTASASRLRATYSPPTMSRITSTPRPPVTIADGGDEIGVAIVDGELRAESLAGRALFRRPGRREHARTERPRQLNRRRADAARPAMDEQRFAGLQTAALEDVGPDREERLGERRAADGGHPRGDRQTLRRGRHAELGVSAAGDERADRVADVPVGYVGADRVDRAGDLEPGDVRRAGRRRVLPSALHHVGPIDTGRGHPDQHFARARNRPRTLDRNEHLGAPRLANFDGNHGSSTPIASSRIRH